jgi:hypothetical protein
MALDDARRYAIEPDGEREAEKTPYHRDGICPPRCSHFVNLVSTFN